MNLKRIIPLIFVCIVSICVIDLFQVLFALIDLVTMLSGARIEKNAYLSQKIFDRICLLFGNDEDYLSSATVLLANTYGLNGDFARTSELRMQMSQSKIKKVPGRSSTIVNGKLVVRLMKRTNSILDKRRFSFQALLRK